ncbi:phospho-sugar mutase [Propionicicella superfundia]|uniref:phospho-sugar mutase n=1 Tax=Propionicicella superfundia TaxID=348582 RepID=UPI000419EAF5|nr:phospho-sugar mutase [Propionicicella superfundia]
MPDLFTTAADWLAADPDPADRAEVARLLAEAQRGGEESLAELGDRFSGRLAFGTAGLRGRMGGGPNRMNTAVVTTATAGLAGFLQERLPAGRHVVIGYDGRHRSAAFARTAAGVLVAAGARVSLLPRMLPTPVLAFSLLHMDADAGVMITASHNPAADNGYKVYLGARVSDAGGAQIVPPADAQIFAAIEAVGPANLVPVASRGWDLVSEDVLDAYVTTAAGLVAGAPTDLRVTLTAMHGVGAETAQHAFAAAGYTDVHLVPSQARPDPDFPTVAFPNPEEPGALDLAAVTASEVGADLVVALDPDADRCAVAVPDATSPSGWRPLSGDELGALLGSQAAAEHEGDPTAVLSRSIVSSSLLGRIAAAHGVGAAETLTGFKWITRAPGVVYGYEEAIGYCVNPAAVRDKDGITAGLKTMALAARLKAEARTLDDLLTDLAIAHGLHLTAPLTFRVADLSLIATGMANLRAVPPRELAGSPVVDYADLTGGWRGLPPTDGVRLATAIGDRVVVRPSGTEPKLKCYLEAVEPVAGAADLPRARRAAQGRIDRIKDELRLILRLP